MLEAFLEMMSAERALSANTLAAYSADVRAWLDFSKGVPDKSWSMAMRQEFIDHLGAGGLSLRSIARRLSAVRQFFWFLKSEGILDTDPWHDAPGLKYPSPLPRILTPEEIFLLLEGAENDTTAQGKRLWALMELLYATGIRVSELVSLPMSCLHEAASLYGGGKNEPMADSGASPDAIDQSPWQTLRITGKGGKERFVFLTKQGALALATYLEVRHEFLPLTSKGAAQKYVFASRGGLGHLTRQRMGQYLRALSQEIGLTPPYPSPHDIRHAFASHLLHRGADLVSLKQLLGHCDIGTTEIYTHVTCSQWAELLTELHPLGKAQI